MKKVLSIILSLVLIASLGTIQMSVYAEEPSYTGPNDSDHAYLSLRSNGENYSFYFMGSIGDANLDGVSYDLSTNTLSLTNYNEPGTIIEASEMGSNFKISITGENNIQAISVLADKYMGSLTVTGDGSLTINSEKAYNDIPLYLDANLTNSYLNIEDTVRLSICTNDIAVKVLNSLSEEPIICNNTEYRISTYEDSYSQSKWINAYDTQMNEFNKIKDSEHYTTYVYDNNLNDTFKYEFEVMNRNIDGVDVVIAKLIQDEMGNPVLVDDNSVDYSNRITACQILDRYERAAVEKADDDTLYTLTEYTVGEKGPFWDIHKVINDEEIGIFFYPVAEQLTEKPTNYTPVIENIENNYQYIEYDFKNYNESTTCEHNYKGTIGAYPQCEIEGSMDYECTKCHDTYFEPIPANGHKYDDGVVTTPATCTSDGVKTYTCIACEKSYTEKIEATGHKYTTTIKKATTTADGKIVEKCDCGNTRTATINKASSVKLSATSYTYDGKTKKPAVTVKDSQGNKIASTNYSVAYSNNKSVGKATAKITFKGNYSGTKTLSFSILPKGTSLAGLSATSKGFTAKWKKQTTQTTGYEIQVATDNKFKKNVKTYTVPKNKTVSKKITKLKAKSKYFVKIRTYKTVSGKKYYSSWSSTKNITTKK